MLFSPSLYPLSLIFLFSFCFGFVFRPQFSGEKDEAIVKSRPNGPTETGPIKTVWSSPVFSSLLVWSGPKVSRTEAFGPVHCVGKQSG
ncbi:hypothetical protein LguiA_002817 [Lonicera macranthoides]